MVLSETAWNEAEPTPTGISTIREFLRENSQNAYNYEEIMAAVMGVRAEEVETRDSDREQGRLVAHATLATQVRVYLDLLVHDGDVEVRQVEEDGDQVSYYRASV